MKTTFNEFPHTTIPNRLLKDGWVDVSWHNDIAPNMTKMIGTYNDEYQYDARIWKFGNDAHVDSPHKYSLSIDRINPGYECFATFLVNGEKIEQFDSSNLAEILKVYDELTKLYEQHKTLDPDIILGAT